MSGINQNTSQRFLIVPFQQSCTFLPRVNGDIFGTGVVTKGYRRPITAKELALNPEILLSTDSVFQIVKTSFTPNVDDYITDSNNVTFTILMVEGKLNSGYFLLTVREHV